ncbi:katanin p80 WD40 repeat-containing subunit B1-like [Saccoglossus kowalevskii]|uniref:Katanin p80 WD40 repeat-containing subunit B1 n=1 Tax=Saccoglossus kowalevskii TaxID=10224 RepID=A0ABM0MAE2_SACKO|nr:PREDICTED: katanin p80 WD40 repeat-containing subunit B1-like [Saccoglossus kowalevskii]
MAATKRAWKLQDFVAHSANVNCLALGPKSGRVMVTGGEDKKVNMWAVGKPNCIMSLSGHTSPVESVRFGNTEELVAAGSQSGTIKIWDLEAAKIVRTLTGHKSSIQTLDFHPYGEFVASGSFDTNVKLWDVRRKGCIYTYRGHTNRINSVRFSPDGRWVASAGEDGLAKLWDLAAGKLINEFKHHTGPVNNIEFHPNEFLLATGSADRTVKFWDLENFNLVGTTDKEASPIRCILFHQDGNVLFSGGQDSLHVYSWEPVKCFDSYSMGWGKVADMTTSSNQLIGASYSQSNVSLFVVDLARTNMSGDISHVEQPSKPVQQQIPFTASGHRKNFVTERPHTQCSGGDQGAEMKTEPEEEQTQDHGEDDQSPAQIENPDDYRELFQPRKHLARSPPKEPFPAPLADPVPVAVVPANNQQNVTRPVTQSVSRPVTQSVSQTHSSPPRQEPEAPVHQPPPAAPVHQPPPAAQHHPVSNVIPSDRDKPVGLDMNAFLPKQPQHSVAPSSSVNNANIGPPEVSESEIISAIEKGHGSMCSVLTSRHKNLDVVRSIWTSGEIRTALESAINMNDLAIIVDLLNVMCLKTSLWKLDLCVVLLPKIEELVESKYENYILTSCQAIKLIMKSFSQLIKSNITSPPLSGVDISREERYNKCKKCYDSLVNIRYIIEQKQHLVGKIGSTFREVKLILGGLDS